jgi:PQQ-dependent dehydrogenase (methanol/ethanol family)
MRLSTGILAVLALVSSGAAFANDDVLKLQSVPSNWAMQLGNYAGQRYSPLDQITTANADKLHVDWTFSTGVLRGHEGGPLVIGDTMYVHTPFPNIVYALSLKDKGTVIWKYEPRQDPNVIPVMCCDTVNRGVAYADNRIFLAQADNTLVALDAKDGKVLWQVKNGDHTKGETLTAAPVVIKDKVIVGISGGEFGIRGHLTAYDVKDGHMVWRAYSTGSDADVMIDPQKTMMLGKPIGEKDLGLTTWPGDQWKLGGGSTWGWYTYDPQLDLLYYGTGNPGSWNPAQRVKDGDRAKSDNKWSMTIFARNPDTGEAKWVFQKTPFDEWDYDGVNENILVDMKVDGKDRKALVHFDRNGFAYVLDRADGTLLRANKYVTTDWAEKVDLKTGRPIKVREHSPLELGRNVAACPSAMGGKDQQPGSVDPADPTKFYMPTNNWCMELEPQERTHTQQGTVYVFANVYMFPEKPGTTGKLKKFDVLTGKADWEIPDPYPNWGGSMVTDGGLVFYGSLGGDFRAVDRNSGKVLWHRKLASGIIGNPITYKVKGKQYVSILAGIGGWIGVPVTAGLDLNDKFGAIGATAMTKAANLDKIPQAGTLFTFRVYE